MVDRVAGRDKGGIQFPLSFSQQWDVRHKIKQYLPSVNCLCLQKIKDNSLIKREKIVLNVTVAKGTDTQHT